MLFKKGSFLLIRKLFVCEQKQIDKKKREKKTNGAWIRHKVRKSEMNELTIEYKMVPFFNFSHRVSLFSSLSLYFLVVVVAFLLQLVENKNTQQLQMQMFDSLWVSIFFFKFAFSFKFCCCCLSFDFRFGFLSQNDDLNQNETKANKRKNFIHSRFYEEMRNERENTE